MLSKNLQATLLACLGLSLTTAYGQAAGNATALSNIPMAGTAGIEPVSISVLDDKMRRLDRPAAVRVVDENTKRMTWQPTSKESEARFEDLGPGNYAVEVNAVGYLTARKELQLVGESHPVHFQVMLHPDPDAVELKLDAASLPGKAGKEAEKGLADLKAWKLKDAQKHLENACNQAPSSSQTEFLLGFALFQQNDFDRAQAALEKAISMDPKNMDAINQLARLHLVKGDYGGARTLMEKAVADAPESTTGHALLADAYLNLRDYKNALTQADLALEKTKSGASSAQIVRGEALAYLGRDQEALQALKLYLDTAPDTVPIPKVQEFMAALEQRHPTTTSPSTGQQK